MDFSMNGRLPYLKMMQPSQQPPPGLFGYAPPPPPMSQQMAGHGVEAGNPMMLAMMRDQMAGGTGVPSFGGPAPQPGQGAPGGQGGGQNLLSPETFMKLMQMFGGG